MHACCRGHASRCWYLGLDCRATAITVEPVASSGCCKQRNANETRLTPEEGLVFQCLVFRSQAVTDRSAESRPGISWCRVQAEVAKPPRDSKPSCVRHLTSHADLTTTPIHHHTHFDAFLSPSPTTPHCYRRQSAASPRPIASLFCRQLCYPSRHRHEW
jgi:hypothetical protein